MDSANAYSNSELFDTARPAVPLPRSATATIGKRRHPSVGKQFLGHWRRTRRWRTDKAAYHDKNAGLAAAYSDYAAGSSSVPNNNPPSSDTGNSANFYIGGSTTGNSSYPLTDAGAYTLSGSQWNETLFFGSFRGDRGGSWFSGADNLPHLELPHRQPGE